MGTNRRILVDNATLSGVERLIGLSKTRNLNNIANDILCLEKLVTAILFSDQLLGIDDYKEEYRSARLKSFSFVDFLKIAQPSYEKLAAEASVFARSMTFSFDGSKPAGDVITFFESLRLDPQLRWNVFVSSEYLTLSFLVDNTKITRYEHSIDSVFRNEATDRDVIALSTDYVPKLSVADRPDIDDVKKLVNAFATQNPQFRGADGKSTLERMLFGYGWSAERSHFYNAVAQMEGADAYLAPLRDAFCESCCRLDYPSQVDSLINNLKAKTQEAVSSILEPGGQAKFAMRLPFFTSYLISKTGGPQECIELALTMRNLSEFQECRTIFHNLENFSPDVKIKEINGILRYLDQSCVKLMSKYGISNSNGLQFSVSLGLTGVSLGVSGKIGQLLRAYKNRSFTRVFRNIAQDMLNIERLGGLYEKVCSSIKEHPEASYSSVSVTPKFMEFKDRESGRPATL